MKVIITSKNLELSNSLKTFTEKKFAVLKKLIRVDEDGDEFKKDLIEIFVEVERETTHHRKGDVLSVKAQMNVPGKKSLFVKAKGDNISSLVVKAKDLLKREIEKYKFKSVKKKRK